MMVSKIDAFRPLRLPQEEVVMAKNKSLKMIISKSGIAVPVVNGIYLHSEFDPIQEAKKFAKSLTSQIKCNNRILVFGLGLGYHIDEIVNLMCLYHGTNIKLLVIEPNRELTAEYFKNRPSNQNIVNIHCKETVEELFTSRELISFMAESPSVIKHTPSYNLNAPFFDKVLTFSSPQDLKRTRTTIKNFSVRREIARYPQTSTLEEINRLNIPAKEKWMEHLMKGFNSFAYNNEKEK